MSARKWILAMFLAMSLLLASTAQAGVGDGDCMTDLDQPNWMEHFSAGVDLSKWQKVNDWSKLKNSDGLSFVFIKATEGVSYLNPNFSEDWNDMADSTSSQLKARGAYHFYHPSVDALTQAKYFLRTMGRLGATDLPPVLDLETFDHLNVKSAKVMTKMAGEVLKWLRYVEKQTQRIPIIYTSPKFWQKLGAKDPAFAHFSLFMAKYQTKVCPAAMAPWKQWAFLQYSEEGNEDGVDNKIDLDIFNGNASDLQQFIDDSIVGAT